ncbi:MAG: FkbM family methyltransferase [Chloroflexi bacterium]|nr:MAG: FkbM family methyltransferase [Chloroflexota bacterium]
MITWGILRSLAIYYGVPGKGKRLRQFYAPLVPPNSLCFDIGAHVGDRTRAWVALGARVIAVEPQPAFVWLLRLLYGRFSQVTILQAALGSQPGEAYLYISQRTPTLSTLSAEWQTCIRTNQRFRKARWNQHITVPVLTLDTLITRYGLPAFCKIDVEGYELEVLRGLSTPIPALSFEYVPAVIEIALACIHRLASLGPYQFNWSEGEQLTWRSAHWLTAAEMSACLQQLSPLDNSGDVYACLPTVAPELVPE